MFDHVGIDYNHEISSFHGQASTHFEGTFPLEHEESPVRETVTTDLIGEIPVLIPFTWKLLEDTRQKAIYSILKKLLWS